MRLLLTVLLTVLACADAAPGTADLPSDFDAGLPDASTTDDSLDAGDPIDAGDALDAGEAPDASEPIDAGTEPDAGSPSDCSGLSVVAGDYVWQLRSGDADRTFRVHVPASYDASKKTPLVLNFHGIGSWGEEQDARSELSDLADQKGFIAVHPEGVDANDIDRLYLPADQQSFNAGRCCGAAQTWGVDDVSFVEAMLDELEAKLCVDTARVYAAGFSNGGMLSHRLACDLADRVAAIASIAGVNVTDGCRPSRPVPVMHFHGTADFTVWYGGNPLFPGAEATVDDWVSRNGCSGPETATYENGDTICRTRSACEGGADVTLCTIDGGGHTWPGGTMTTSGKTSRDVSATREMWEFFVAHPMP